jgi:hypothetical protein
MVRSTHRRRLSLLSLLVALAVLATSPSAYAVQTSQFFGFEKNLQGWTRDHFIDCEHEPTPCTFEWKINRSTQQAKSGTHSLKATLNGLNDDGTIWMERQFNFGANTEATVTVTFWLWSESEADINTWPVVAFIGKRNPETEDHMTIVGQTDRKAGWARYEFTRTVSTGATGNVWVAFGFGATWESERTYFMDSVRVESSTP